MSPYKPVILLSVYICSLEIFYYEKIYFKRARIPGGKKKIAARARMVGKCRIRNRLGETAGSPFSKTFSSLGLPVSDPKQITWAAREVPGSPPSPGAPARSRPLPPGCRELGRRAGPLRFQKPSLDKIDSLSSNFRTRLLRRGTGVLCRDGTRAGGGGAVTDCSVI